MINNNPKGWGDKRFELLIDLVYEIGKTLGYDRIDKATLRDDLYVPKGYEDQEEEFRQIRQAMLQVLKGQHPVPVTMVGSVEVAAPMQALEELPIPHKSALPLPDQTCNSDRFYSFSPKLDRNSGSFI